MDMLVEERARALKAPFASRYDNFIGGRFVAPGAGRYFQNISPVTGQVVGEIARSDARDIEQALDAAHAAADSWGRTPVADPEAARGRAERRHLPFARNGQP